MGGVEIPLVGGMEPTVRYHSGEARILTHDCESNRETVSDGQFDWGGRLLKGNGGVQRFPRPGWKSGAKSIRAQGSLTVRPTSRAGTKVGPSDPLVGCGTARA